MVELDSVLIDDAIQIALVERCDGLSVATATQQVVSIVDERERFPRVAQRLCKRPLGETVAGRCDQHVAVVLCVGRLHVVQTADVCLDQFKVLGGEATLEVECALVVHQHAVEVAQPRVREAQRRTALCNLRQLAYVRLLVGFEGTQTLEVRLRRLMEVAAVVATDADEAKQSLDLEACAVGERQVAVQRERLLEERQRLLLVLLVEGDVANVGERIGDQRERRRRLGRAKHAMQVQHLLTDAAVERRLITQVCLDVVLHRADNHVALVGRPLQVAPYLDGLVQVLCGAVVAAAHVAVAECPQELGETRAAQAVVLGV